MNNPKNNSGFVAGTLVHTQTGLKPIEQIQVGDFVLSKPENGEGERTYKRVLNIFVHEEKTVRKIDYSTHDGSYDGCLCVTDNHPFWVIGIGWTLADLVECGQELELADGSRVMVYDNFPVFHTPRLGVGWCSHYGDDDSSGYDYDFINQTFVQNCVLIDDEILYSDDPLLKLKVYNIEVENLHTYFVGELGVWVHDAIQQTS